MANVIKHNTVFIECMALINTNAFGEGELLGVFRQDGRWITKDSNEKRYQVSTSQLRENVFCNFINQYSMNDIILYLMERNEDYQTVYTGFLIEAIETTFEEAVVCCIEDIYKYISENLV